MRGPEEKPLSLAGPRVCTSCTPEVTAAVPYSGALESKLCIVSGSPRNAVYLVLGPTARSTQLVPRPLLGLPGSCPGLVLPLESSFYSLSRKGEGPGWTDTPASRGGGFEILLDCHWIKKEWGAVVWLWAVGAL